MRRILLVMSVAALMVAMMALTALPAMAAPGNGAKHVSFGDDNDDYSGKAVFTPSGVANYTSHVHPKDEPAGGTGGGGAIVGNEGHFVIPTEEGTIEDTEAHFTFTPSGNSTSQAHRKI